MFHAFVCINANQNRQKQFFLETINSPRCTVRSLLIHSKVAHEIAKDKRFGSVSEMKEIVLKRWPHLKHVVKEMHFMATEPRKNESKKKKGHGPSLLKITLTTLLAAMAVLGGVAGDERKKYHKKVAEIRGIDTKLVDGANFPQCGTGDDPVEHVIYTLEHLGVGSTEYDLWKEAKTNSAARTEAQQAHRGGTSGMLANAFRKIQGSKDANVDSLIAKYAKRFEGDVKQVVIKIGTPSKTNATADTAAFVFLQIIAPLIATAATGWTIKLIHERASDSECTNDDTETIEDLSKEEAFMVVDHIVEDAKVLGGFASTFVRDDVKRSGERQANRYEEMEKKYK